MPILPAINQSIRAIQEITNGAPDSRRRPPSGQPLQETPTGGKRPSDVKDTKLPSEREVVEQIRDKEIVKANAKVIQTGDEIIGTILDIKV